MVIWYERKLLAKMQYRVGPLYAGRIEGVLQSFADLFKLLFKEIVIPAKADALFFMGVPFAMMAASGALLAVIPVSPTSYIATSPYSLLIAIAVLGFFPIITVMAGWASSNKFSFIGGIRALYQMISYEIPLIIAALGVVILSGGTLNLFRIVAAQNRIWFLIPMILGAIVFYITAMAEVERIPFDIPEADSELVAGWLTEYTSMAFGVINLAIYIKLYALSSLFTILFLGRMGWPRADSCSCLVHHQDFDRDDDLHHPERLQSACQNRSVDWPRVAVVDRPILRQCIYRRGLKGKRIDVTGDF